MDPWEPEKEDAWDSVPLGTPSPEPSTPRKRKRGEDGPLDLYVSMLDAEERQKQEEIDNQLALSIGRGPKTAEWRGEYIPHKTAAKAEVEDDNLPSLEDLQKQELENLRKQKLENLRKQELENFQKLEFENMRKEGPFAKKITAFAKVLAHNNTFTESTARQIYFQNIVGVMFAFFGNESASSDLVYTVVQFIEEF